jgi:glycosyltransferase involved in cell wall biosynthesis
MKILFYAPFPKKRFVGGITVLANHLKDRTDYFESKNIYIYFFKSNRIERSDSSKGQIHYKNIINFLRLRTDLKKEIDSNYYDIIHIHTSKKLALLKDLLVIKSVYNKFDGKIILHIHFADIEKILFNNKIFNIIIKKILENYVDEIIVLSQNLFEELLDFGLNKNKISILYNFQPSIYPKPSRNKLNLGDNFEETKKILFLGSLDERKGIEDLLKSLSYLNNSNFHLYVGGTFKNNKFEKKIKSYINNNKLQNKVEFLGYINGNSKLNRLLKTDIFILPSYGEGLPISILEAISSGCAIISTKVGAIPEIIKEDYNGYLVEPGDIEELSKKINILLNNNELLDNIKINNLNEYDKYSDKIFIDNLISIYKD